MVRAGKSVLTNLAIRLLLLSGGWLRARLCPTRVSTVRDCVVDIVILFVTSRTSCVMVPAASPPWPLQRLFIKVCLCLQGLLY